MEVFMIRHTSVDVPKGTCYGWTDVPVAATFEQEAAETKKELERLLSIHQQPTANTQHLFDKVYSSPLSRASKLAAYCGYPHPRLDSRLKEMFMGDWEMQVFDDIAKTDPQILKWYEDYMHLQTTNGEGFPQLYERVADFLDELKKQPYERVAVFAHGGVLVCGGIYAGLFPAEDAFSHLVGYGGIQVITL
ncbi:MAG: alpha-ribazole phosphatase family protein [Prevotella sp.]|nr:alpha-ribazole phosphatase family protein [Prevotella sp.]